MTRRDWYIIGGLTVAAALLRFVNLPHPHEIVFDETYFANFAHNYLTGTKFFDAEPPLGKFLIAGGEQLSGFNSFGWRLAPAVFGTAVIPLIYMFVKRLFGGTVLPALAAGLALLDGLLLVESRTALLDGFVVFFNLLSYLLFICSLQARTKERSLIWLIATGLAFGFALSVKWITLAFIAPALGLLVVLALAKKRRIQRFFKVRSAQGLFDSVGAKKQNLQHPVQYLVWLGAIPAALYSSLFLIHVPYDSTGQGFFKIHQQIFNYHKTLKASHPYGSAWYTWPFLIRPVAIYFKVVGGHWQGVVALGNPVIWWTGLLALVYALGRVLKLRSLPLLFILLAFLAHYGPWSMIGRVLFVYHYLGGLPFVIIALAYMLNDSLRWRPRDTSGQLLIWILLLAAAAAIGGMLGRSLLGQAPGPVGFGLGSLLAGLPVLWLALTDQVQWRWGKRQVAAFIGLTALAFVYFYPIWTGIGLDPADYLRHMWLRSWI
jgi:dolichyl-phosphate-mannose-protein mannosyltransferase